MESPQPALPRREVARGRIIDQFLPTNLRGRFLAVLFGVLLPSLTLFGVLHHDSVKRSLLREVDQTLVNRANEVEQILAASGIHSASDLSHFTMVTSALMITSAPEVYVDIVARDGTTLWSSQNLAGKIIPVPTNFYELDDSIQNITQPDGLKLRRLIRPTVLTDGTTVWVVLAESLTHLDIAMQGSIGRTILLGLVVLTLTEVLGSAAFRGVFLPLQKLVDTTETIVATDDVTQRVPVYQDSDPEIRRTAVAFNSLMDRVEQLLDMAKRLLADTSHELRNPLTVLMTNLDLLREDLTKDQREEVIAEAQHTVRRLTRIVSDLLLLSRTEAVSESVELEEIEVGRLVEQVVRRFSRGQEVKDKIQLGEIDSTCLALLNAERTEQILTNLLENGLRYCGDDVVHVGVAAQGKEVVISVKDNGCGIAPEEQEKIFLRFYRVDKSRNRHSGGTGLGLPVARALARLQNGDVLVNSQVGQGSNFQIIFPRCQLLAESGPLPSPKTDPRS